MSNHYQKYGKKWYESNRESELERNKEYYQTSGKQKKLEAYPERRRRILKSRYGITPERFDELFKEQGGQCAICKQEYHSTLHIDHDHETKAIRGLLCNNCNRGLGHFKDSRENLEAAIAYLEQGDVQRVVRAISESAKGGVRCSELTLPVTEEVVGSKCPVYAETGRCFCMGWYDECKEQNA